MHAGAWIRQLRTGVRAAGQVQQRYWRESDTIVGGSEAMLRRIDSEKLGRWSLRLDAAYCAVLGIAVAMLAEQVAHGVALPPALITVAGIAVVLWAGGVLWMLSRLPLRTVLRFVMTANVMAAVAVGFVSVMAATVLIVVVVLTVAIDVALFATSQAIALRALPVR